MKQVKKHRKLTRAQRRRKRLRRLCLVILVPLLVLGAAGWLGWRFFHPVVFAAGSEHAELGEEYNPKEQIRYVFLGSPDEVEVEGTVDTSKPGVYELTYTRNGQSLKREITVADTKAPEIKLRDVATDLTGTVSPADFVESASDASAITYQFTKSPSLKAEGEEEVEVEASDAYGHTAKATAKFTRAKDTKAPVMNSGTLEVLQGRGFDAEEVSIGDDLDPNPQYIMRRNDVNTDVPGTYKVVYQATDRSGNTAELTREVVVKKDPDYAAKIVYLTFDDGPSYNTGKILDILDKYDAKATFFVTGNGQDYNDEITRAYKDGHTIGLHTYSHDYGKLYASEDAYFADLQEISDMVKELTGEESKIIRFPGGSSNTISADTNKGLMSRLAQEVEARGYQYFDWNADSTDASGQGVAPSKIVANATASDLDRVVLLMHDTFGKDTTVDALPEIIQSYRDRGYIFRGLDLDSFTAHHPINN